MAKIVQQRTCMCPRSRQHPSDIAIGVARIEQTKGRKEETNKQKQLVPATRAVNRAAIPAHSFKRMDRRGGCCGDSSVRSRHFCYLRDERECDRVACTHARMTPSEGGIPAFFAASLLDFSRVSRSVSRYGISHRNVDKRSCVRIIGNSQRAIPRAGRGKLCDR